MINFYFYRQAGTDGHIRHLVEFHSNRDSLTHFDKRAADAFGRDQAELRVGYRQNGADFA